MKTIKLTRNEIKDLQPAAFASAEDRATVLGGYELPIDWNSDLEPLRDAAQTDFQRGAEPDYSEPCEGDECVHVLTRVGPLD